MLAVCGALRLRHLIAAFAFAMPTNPVPLDPASLRRSAGMAEAECQFDGASCREMQYPFDALCSNCRAAAQLTALAEEKEARTRVSYFAETSSRGALGAAPQLEQRRDDG